MLYWLGLPFVMLSMIILLPAGLLLRLGTVIQGRPAHYTVLDD